MHDGVGAWEAEHLSRYCYAATHAEGATVLDVACGTGYGSKLMAGAGADVVTGIDNDPEVIRAAVEHLTAAESETVRFVCGDALRLPVEGGSVDLVASFETIEHLREPDAFICELRRVVSPTGLVLLSTPNAHHTGPRDGEPRNPYHLHEYAPSELESALSASFGEVAIAGQRVAERFRPCPYWERPQVHRNSASAALKSTLWKMLRRLPAGLGDRSARLLLGHPLLPSAGDFTLDWAEPDAGHVLFAKCRP